jgi:hypothetical protein
MSSKPKYNAYVVTQPKQEGAKAYWTKVGAVWPHKDGNGFDILITEGISVTGRIVCTEPKEKDSPKE